MCLPNRIHKVCHVSEVNRIEGLPSVLSSIRIRLVWETKCYSESVEML